MRILIVVMAALCATSVMAEEWLDFSPRQTGMGGMSTGARGASAFYWNAGAGARMPWESASTFDLEFDISATVAFGVHGTAYNTIFNTVQAANDLHDRFGDGAFDVSSGSLSFEDIRFAVEVFDLLDSISSLQGEGVYVGSSVGLSARWAGAGFLPRDSFGFWTAGFGYGAFSPIVDLDGLGNFRLTDESGAQWEALLGIAIANSGTGAPTPSTSAGQAYSNRLQTAGYSAVNADALAAQLEEVGINFGGKGADILFDFLVNTLNGTGNSLESGANPLEGNQSGFLMRGMAFYEFGFGYSFGVPLFGASDWLSVGVNVKLIQAYAFSQTLLVQDMDEQGIEDSFDNLQEQLTDSYSFQGDERFNVGLDLGVVFTPQLPMIDGLAISLMARNINGPEFRFDSNYTGAPELIRLDPQFRLGASWTILPSVIPPLTVGFEADLNAVSSDILPKYHTQYVRFGAAFEPSFGNFGIGVRAGAFKNIADADEPVVLTAGFGVRAFVVKFDIGAQYGLRSEDFGSKEDFENIPTRLSLAMELGVFFRF